MEEKALWLQQSKMIPISKYDGKVNAFDNPKAINGIIIYWLIMTIKSVLGYLMRLPKS